MGVDRMFEEEDRRRELAIRKRIAEETAELLAVLKEVAEYLEDDLKYPHTGTDLPNPLRKVTQILGRFRK